MIKKIFFKILFNLISIIYKPFLKYKKPVRFNNIAVFGKGESVKFFIKNFYIKRKNLDLIILTNYEKNDLLSFELKKYIDDTPIILLGNITEPLLYLNNVSNLNIFEVIVQRFYPDKEKRDAQTGLEMLRQNFKMDTYSFKVKYLNNYIRNFLKRNSKIKKNSNCGIIGTILACSYKPKNLYVFGIDFYETGYFNMPLLKNMDLNEKKRLLSMKKKFKELFNIIIKDHKSIKFKIFTKSRIKKKYPNSEIINYL